MRACVLWFLLTIVAATAQSPKPEVPRLHDGKPDLNGVWDIPYTNDMGRGVPGGLPFTPLGADDFKNYDPTKFDLHRALPPGGFDAPGEHSHADGDRANAEQSRFSVRRLQ
jgi:hypothetical protein